MRPFFALVWQDWRLSLFSGGGALPAIGFFAAAATAVPLAVGPDLPLLARLAGGVLWVLAALSALLSLERMVQGDAEDGTLVHLALSPLSLEAVAAAKILAHWLSTGVPLVVLSLVAAVLFAAPAETYAPLVLSLLIGTPAISAVGGIGAGLTVSIRRGGVLIALIVLPLLAPAVIFGASAGGGGDGGGAIWFLAAFSVMAVSLSPFAMAAALRHALAQ